MGFGSVVKKLLSDKNMTIKDLSEASGISLNTLYSITKRDSTNIKMDTLRKISQAAGITDEEMLQRIRSEHERAMYDMDNVCRLLQQAESMVYDNRTARKKFSESLKTLTGYEYSDQEIDIVISAATLLKEGE